VAIYGGTHDIRAMNALFGRASANWHGNVIGGTGTLTTGSGAVKKMCYGSLQHRNGAHTCPDELMAAAQAGCFSLALASEVAEAGFTPDHIETVATLRLEELTTGWTVVEIFLDTTAIVGRMSQTEFVDAALRAKERCSVVRLFTARIWMQARLKPPLPFARQNKRKRGAAGKIKRPPILLPPK
jgi:osmotically inducible protein OsmC